MSRRLVWISITFTFLPLVYSVMARLKGCNIWDGKIPCRREFAEDVFVSFFFKYFMGFQQTGEKAAKDILSLVGFHFE